MRAGVQQHAASGKKGARRVRELGKRGGRLWTDLRGWPLAPFSWIANVRRPAHSTEVPHLFWTSPNNRTDSVSRQGINLKS